MKERIEKGKGHNSLNEKTLPKRDTKSLVKNGFCNGLLLDVFSLREQTMPGDAFTEIIMT